MLSQVHGARVLTVGAEGATRGCEAWVRPRGARPPEGDALVARCPGFCLAVLTADCVPLALGSAEGVYGAVHVGWKGLVQGIVGHAYSAMRALGATEIWAGVGPFIGPCCYRFDAPELGLLAASYGEDVRGRTLEGARALDLRAALTAAVAGERSHVVFDAGRCTGCSDDLFSHRAAGDQARQAMFVWSEQRVPSGRSR
jgi:purine-nucleoside/S-methyl-5'-thioadenosine phosphorylase / adenosine deaminase